MSFNNQSKLRKILYINITTFQEKGKKKINEEVTKQICFHKELLLWSRVDDFLLES